MRTPYHVNIDREIYRGLPGNRKGFPSRAAPVRRLMRLYRYQQRAYCGHDNGVPRK